MAHIHGVALVSKCGAAGSKRHDPLCTRSLKYYEVNMGFTKIYC